MGWENPLEEGMATPVFLPGESHGQSSLASHGQQDRKESGMTEATQQAHSMHAYTFGIIYQIYTQKTDALKELIFQ